MFLGETTKFVDVKVWNHPIETNILKWLFRVKYQKLVEDGPPTNGAMDNPW